MSVVPNLPAAQFSQAVFPSGWLDVRPSWHRRHSVAPRKGVVGPENQPCEQAWQADWPVVLAARPGSHE